MRCVFCGEVKGHLYVNVVKKLFHCFRCGASGTIEKLLQVLGKNQDGLSYISTAEVSRNVQNFSKNKEIFLPHGFCFLKDSSCELSEKIKKYLYSRGITDWHIEKYRIGYCSSGKYYGRVIVPIFMFGRLVYWIARAIYPCERKILNPADVSKRSIIFGYDFARVDSREYVVICEGVFDAMTIGTNAVALLGKEMSEEQLYLLLSLDKQKYVVALDADAYAEAKKVAIKLLRAGVWVSVIKLPSGDPNSLGKRVMHQLIDSSLARPVQLEDLV